MKNNSPLIPPPPLSKKTEHSLLGLRVVSAVAISKQVLYFFQILLFQEGEKGEKNFKRHESSSLLTLQGQISYRFAMLEIRKKN